MTESIELIISSIDKRIPKYYNKSMLVFTVGKSYYIGRVQQIQLLQSGSVSARCYWCILLEHLIAASAHGSAPQLFSLRKATNLKCRNKQIYLRDVLFRFFRC